MEIFLVRHTVFDILKGICYGQTDIPLLAEFEKQARLIINGLPYDVDAIFCSPLSRCSRLAAILPYLLHVQKDSRLLEINFGEWEMKKMNSISSTDPWFNDYINIPVPGGESYFQLYLRVCDFLETIKHSGLRKIIVITHA